MHLAVELAALPAGRLGILALGVEHEGRSLIAQQVRDDQADPLAAAGAGHDQYMLVGFEEQRLPGMAERHALGGRLMQLADLGPSREPRPLAVVGRGRRHGLVAQPEDGARDVASKPVSLVAVDVHFSFEGENLVEQHHRDADQKGEQGADHKANDEDHHDAAAQQHEGRREDNHRPRDRSVEEEDGGRGAADRAAQHHGERHAAQDQPLAVEPVERIVDHKAKSQARRKPPEVECQEDSWEVARGERAGWCNQLDLIQEGCNAHPEHEKRPEAEQDQGAK